MDEPFRPPANPPGPSVVFISFQLNRRMQHQSADVDAELMTVFEDGGEEDPYQRPSGPSQDSGAQWGPVSGPVSGPAGGLVSGPADSHSPSQCMAPCVAGGGAVMTPFLLNVDSDGSPAFLNVVLTRF